MTSPHDRSMRTHPGPDGAHSAAATQDASLGTLIKSLGTDTSTLIQQELALLKAEARDIVTRLRYDLARMGVAAGLALVGVNALAAFTIIGLGQLLGGRYWLSALLVGGAATGTGWRMSRRAVRDMRRGGLRPEQTLESLREDKAFFEREVSEFRSDLKSDIPNPRVDRRTNS